MSETKLLLWTDTESTGLLDGSPAPTFLEFAWTITDPWGVQLTPLSQVFCALRPIGVDDGRKPMRPQVAEKADGTPDGYWDDGDNVPGERVQEMHRDNGLTTEWAVVDNAWPSLIVRDWVELQRLLLDDLKIAGYYRGLGTRELRLAGGGVGHYESRFLPQAMPQIFNDGRMHYRPHDMSVVLSGLRTRLGPAIDFPGTADHLIAAMGPDDHTGKAGLDHAGWSDIEVHEHHFDAAFDNDPAAWVTVGRDNHRAAVGVARALMAHRLLPGALRALIPSAA